MTQAAFKVFAGILAFLVVFLGATAGNGAQAVDAPEEPPAAESREGSFHGALPSAHRPVLQREEGRAEPSVAVPLRRLRRAEVTRAVAKMARVIIDEHHEEPFGTEISFKIEGKTYVARIERHYHPPGGDKFPWGYHPGASILVPAAAMVESSAR